LLHPVGQQRSHLPAVFVRHADVDISLRENDVSQSHLSFPVGHKVHLDEGQSPGSAPQFQITATGEGSQKSHESYYESTHFATSSVLVDISISSPHNEGRHSKIENRPTLQRMIL
jgi:hypothetical protein